MGRVYPNIKQERKFIDGIPGQPPDLSQPQIGCRFRVRCEEAIDVRATTEPLLLNIGTDQLAVCHLLSTSTDAIA